jgi:exodeoxyribonuclease VII small subunit
MAAKKTKSFSEARERLDEILEELERDSGDVDVLAARVREASELIRLCRERLATARQEVTEVVASLAAESGAVAGDDDPDVDVNEEAGEEDGDESDAGKAAGGLPF